MSIDELATKVQQIAVDAAKATLERRAEPAPFPHLHCRIWAALAEEGLLRRIMSAEEPLSPLEFVRDQIRPALEGERDHTFVLLCEGEEDQACWWWLVEPPQASPLAERVEKSVYEMLQSAAATGTDQLVHHVYECFPGVLTPDREWVIACLKSYGREARPALWTLQEQDGPAQRVRSHEANLRCLQDLGQRLGYQVHLDRLGFDVQWSSGDGDTLAFVLLDSAALSRLLALPPDGAAPPERKIVIFTEGRQELLRLRLSRSMWLRKPLAEQGWQFIRDTDLLHWADQEEIALADLDSFVGLDLLAAEDRTQLSLI
jgi:hypothetical protein